MVGGGQRVGHVRQVHLELPGAELADRGLGGGAQRLGRAGNPGQHRLESAHDLHVVDLGPVQPPPGLRVHGRGRALRVDQVEFELERHHWGQAHGLGAISYTGQHAPRVIWADPLARRGTEHALELRRRPAGPDHGRECLWHWDQAAIRVTGRQRDFGLFAIGPENVEPQG